MLPLTNAVKDYPWGDPERIPSYLREPADGRPVAEVWMGTHPMGPSRLADGQDLTAVLAADPERWLGPVVPAATGPRLPYLVKLLAAAVPLSLQVHPDAEQAARGFAAEEARGLPLQDPTRSFKDPRHKPELILALDEVRSLIGFRPAWECAQVFAALGSPAAGLADRLASGGDAAIGELFHELVTGLPESAQDLAAACRRIADPAAEVTDPAYAAAVASEVHRLHPDDPGWLISLLLNQVRLAPGEAIFVGCGVVHAHLDGFGIEVMAASDNVLRAGMTGKHRDVDLVRACSLVRPAAPARVRPQSCGPGLQLLAPPVQEFALLLADPGEGPVPVPARGPRLVLATGDGVTVSTTEQLLELERGRAVFVADHEADLTVAGSGTAVVAVVPAALTKPPG